MKLLLVAVHPYESTQAVPLAPAFLQGAVAADPVLRQAVSCQIHEFVADDDPSACADALLGASPDAVAFSVYVWNRETSVAIARLLRQRRPELFLVAGGPEPTANPLPLLGAGPFDALVRGEGEVSFPRLLSRKLNGEPLSGIPGVIDPVNVPHSDDGRAEEAEPSAERLPDRSPLSQAPQPDQIPSPYLDRILPTSSDRAALWQIARGCDFACSFCFDQRGDKVRRLPMGRLERELELFVATGVTQVFVLDSTFNKIPARAKKILRMIARLAPTVHFHFEVRSEFIDAEMAELFASITCSLQIGLQSSAPEVLAGVGRPFDPARFASRIDLLNQSGAIFGFDLIYGLPGDTLERFRSSIDFALALYPNHLDIFPLAVLPGTRLHREAPALGVRHLEHPPYTVAETAGFGAAELETARGLAVACDLFYSRGKAVAWFNCIVRALKLTPSAFLASFAQWLGDRGAAGEQGIGEEEIHHLQRAFLEETFRELKKGKLLPLALDLAAYHHQYARALLAPPTKRLSTKALRGIDLLQTPLRLSESAAIEEFHYDILEILESGEPELAAFASEYHASGSFAVIYPCRDEVCTESISRPWYLLLNALDGTIPAAQLLQSLAISPKAAREFLRFAAEEGIVTPSR